MSSEKEQQSEQVNYHKRLAQGAKLDGSSLGQKGQSENKKGGLEQQKK